MKTNVAELVGVEDAVLDQLVGLLQGRVEVGDVPVPEVGPEQMAVTFAPSGDDPGIEGHAHERVVAFAPPHEALAELVADVLRPT